MTGIGDWSEADFLRSMRDGVAPGGRHLYPAFPYDHFTKVTDEDIKAIYAFVMTRDPVQAETPHNRLAFPFNLRPLLAVWKTLYLKPGAIGRTRCKARSGTAAPIWSKVSAIAVPVTRRTMPSAARIRADRWPAAKRGTGSHRR